VRPELTLNLNTITANSFTYDPSERLVRGERNVEGKDATGTKHGSSIVIVMDDHSPRISLTQ
jgi:hypothetical protein